MWQLVLAADGALKPDGTPFTTYDVDCDFGPVTEYATRQWQGRFDLVVDGIVGRATLSIADDNLVIGNDLDPNRVEYRGSAHTISFGTRLSFPTTGFYYIDAIGGQGAQYLANYGPTTCWD